MFWCFVKWRWEWFVNVGHDALPAVPGQDNQQDDWKLGGRAVPALLVRGQVQLGRCSAGPRWPGRLSGVVEAETNQTSQVRHICSPSFQLSFVSSCKILKNLFFLFSLVYRKFLQEAEHFLPPLSGQQWVLFLCTFCYLLFLFYWSSKSCVFLNNELAKLFNKFAVKIHLIFYYFLFNSRKIQGLVSSFKDQTRAQFICFVGD